MSTLNDRGLGLVHHVASGLCAGMFLYNLLRFVQEPNWRNGTNVVIYAGAYVWETNRAIGHFEQLRDQNL